MKQIVESFFADVATEKIEIYNEFSLQHELGIFLRAHISGKVQFERNVSYDGFDKGRFEKKEMDISIFTDNPRTLETAIELKYPRNRQVPERMFNFCKDIAFLEQLTNNGFKSAYFIAVLDNPRFYSGKATGIYSLFRSNTPITGVITKPTGAKDKKVTIAGRYHAIWKPVIGNTKYCFIEINSTHR